ncbi:unnamed protein product [Thlaspi arvense]|uniref:Agenet domain-containing protein n=1 Tax=Thlaspi arvense TaxID=13288 RepID=A0AAU9SSP4_THLAR|nr:unnamed protein product [Thlaspi arvense]
MQDLHETQVYQKSEYGGEECLMIRPAYPPLYLESELKIKNEQEPLVVTHRSLKVGDLVDWWKDDCFWSGTITKKKGNNAVQVDLTPPPHGEGASYKALRNDLRPSLEWSLEDGWKLPSMDGQKRQCAKLVKREKEDQVMADVCDIEKEQTNSVKKQKTESVKKQKTESVKKQKTESSTEGQLIGHEELPLNINESDSLEAAVFDLEELIVRIEWLKRMLKPDVGEASKAYWKYEDYLPRMSTWKEDGYEF